MNNQNNMINSMNNMGNMGMMNNQNNMMNPMNNNFMNSPMYQMCNQMNIVGNQIMPMMQMGNESQKNIKYLSIRVKMEDGVTIMVQSTSNDKMEKAINNFCCKAVLDKKDYDFFVITKHKAKFDSTVEENGINGNDDSIFVRKKIIKNENENSNEINGNNIRNKEVLEPIIKGIPIQLFFKTSFGLKVDIIVGLKNTFRDAAIIFCNKINIDPYCLGRDLIFLINGKKLNPINDDKTLEQLGLNNNCLITVLDQANVYGA